MSEPQEDAPRVVIRDKRRIDPISGEVRAPAGGQPAGARPGPSAGAPPAANAREDQMSEQDTTLAEQQPAGAEADGDLVRQLAERTEDLQRVTAEYANYRRRVDRDRSLVADQAAERFAVQLFPIADDIERARDHGDLTGAFKVVADRVLGLLDGLGVEPFGVAGDPFDPAMHEAVIHDTSTEVDVPTATTVLRQGFRRGERVLRTAMVAVSDPASPAAAPGGQVPAGQPGEPPAEPSAEPAAAQQPDTVQPEGPAAPPAGGAAGERPSG
ncbi:nucleotide exchange factor GrpE [Geodermatophilus sp. YIM 151500]|uniref:nucleotide exchange factor GrpE n=1 Tax=Geodermatophilus sp. YIM 151500 TaxID=2984531 RepID=UPI0021E3A680|nr:nucleotide exchange factor GrpE [Geodermatophilus sp. YIM 151500]MCV2490222.1 nucleotide exchange factor GrpE [Geodermatophilus sp. YIM 151500]